MVRIRGLVVALLLALGTVFVVASANADTTYTVTTCKPAWKYDQVSGVIGTQS